MTIKRFVARSTSPSEQLCRTEPHLQNLGDVNISVLIESVTLASNFNTGSLYAFDGTKQRPCNVFFRRSSYSAIFKPHSKGSSPNTENSN